MWGLGPMWSKRAGSILNPVIFGLPQFPNLGIASLSKMRKKGPKRQGIKALGAVEAGHEPRLGSPIWRYELLEARRAVQSSAASVTQTPHSRQP